MDHGASERFDRLDDTCGKIFDMLRDHAEKRADLDKRVALLESTSERRSALRSGLTMAGIGAFFGALAAAVGKKTGLWTIALAALLCGCGVTEGGKEANAQNIGGGALLETHSDPKVAEIGHDIKLNSEQIQKEIGAPKVTKPYSPENSAAARNASQAALDARSAWWDLLDMGLGAAAGLFGLGAAWTWVKKLRVDKILKSVVSGVEKFTSTQPPEIAVAAKDAILAKALSAGVSDPLKTVVDANTGK